MPSSLVLLPFEGDQHKHPASADYVANCRKPKNCYQLPVVRYDKYTSNYTITVKLPVDYHYRNLDIDCIVDSYCQYVHQQGNHFDLFDPGLELGNFDMDWRDSDASGLVVVDIGDFQAEKMIAKKIFITTRYENVRNTGYNGMFRTRNLKRKIYMHSQKNKLFEAARHAILTALGTLFNVSIFIQ